MDTTRCARCRDLMGQEAAAEIALPVGECTGPTGQTTKLWGPNVLVHADTCLRASDVLA